MRNDLDTFNEIHRLAEETRTHAPTVLAIRRVRLWRNFKFAKYTSMLLGGILWMAVFLTGYGQKANFVGLGPGFATFLAAYIVSRLVWRFWAIDGLRNSGNYLLGGKTANPSFMVAS